MRTGATFARGSCKALRWLVLAGMVFALGAASAVAQAPRLDPPEAVSPTKVKLEWTLLAGPALEDPYFKTQHDATSSFNTTSTAKPPLQNGSQTTTDVTLTVVAGTAYTFRVAAVYDAADPTSDQWSNTVTFTSEKPPPQPRHPTVGIEGLKVEVGDGHATLTWAPGERGVDVAPERYFEYAYHLPTEGFDGTTKWDRVDGTSVVVRSLTNGVPHTFGVRAVNNGGESIVLSGTGIPSTKPGVPTGLVVRLGPPTDGKVAVTLEWIAPNDGGAMIESFGYEVVGLAGYPRRTTGAMTSVIITGLDADKAAGYTYRVWAENARGAGDPATTTGGGDTTPTGDLTFSPPSQLDLSFPADTPIPSTTLPIATGGTGTITYSISALPNVLMFDPATRMLSGTPTTVAAATTVTYTARDSATPAVTDSLTFTITVTAAGTAPGTGSGPAFLSAGFKPGSAVVTITMSEAVWGGGNAVPPSSFAIQGDGANAATSHTVSMAESGANATFTVTFSEPFSTGSPPTVVYAMPATNVGGHIVDRDNNRLGTGTQATTEMDIVPMLPDVAMYSANLPKGEAITPIQLPQVTGGNTMGSNGTIAYSTTTLPAGLTFNPATRQITGTPTAVTDGKMSIDYIAVDDDANVTPGSPDSVDSRFTLTVQDVPGTPEAPTVTATPNTSESLDVKWDAPDANNSDILYYVVEYREEGGTWVVVPDNVTKTMVTIDTGLMNGTMYEVHVQAVNGIGRSAWSDVGSGSPMLSAAVPAAPAEPMVTATADTPGSLDVTWVAPNANGSDIIDYTLRYKMSSAADWTTMSAPITGTSTTLAGMPAGTSYDVQVQARNANGRSPWSPTGTGSTAAAPVTRTLRGQITEFKLIGAVEEKTIGGVKRLFVDEGEQNVELSVTVQWTHEEIAQIGYDREQGVFVRIKEDRALQDRPSGAGNWLSWIDYEGDVHFPQSFVRDSGYGRLGAFVFVRTPKISAIPEAQRGSPRHVKSMTGKLPVLVLHDNHEAENDAFYIEAEHTRFGDVDLDATAAVNRITPEVVIDDDEEQKVTVKGPSTVYESAGTAEFTLGAMPQRVELPLDVVLEMLDLEGVTVSAARISVSDTSVQIGTGAHAPKVTVHLPASDGDREDDTYQMQASVNLYSLASGGFDTIKVKSTPITVVDVHKLPWLTVSPPSGAVAEGGTLVLTLNVNRNPANTIATDPEKVAYTSEALTIAVRAGGDASSSDFTMTPSSISVEEYKHTAAKNWMQSVKVTIAASADEDIDAETLLLDFEVNGTKAENGPRPDGDTDSVAQANLTIQDATATLVSVRENAYDVIKGALGDPPMLTTGMSAELMGVNLFDYDSAAVSVAYATSVEGGAVTASASGGMVTLMGAMAGDAKVTITATATPTASSLVVNQTKANVAQMTFPVMVEDEDLVYMVAGPDDLNLTEGGMGGMVTVTTNRPVTANTEVMLMRDGSSSASDDDYSLTPPMVTIMAGGMSGSVMVMATDDGMAEEMEMLTLFLVVDGMQMTDKSVSFYIWDAAVPALPLIAQLLLAALLGLGGYRRYLRRR